LKKVSTHTHIVTTQNVPRESIEQVGALGIGDARRTELVSPVVFGVILYDEFLCETKHSIDVVQGKRGAY